MSFDAQEQAGEEALITTWMQKNGAAVETPEAKGKRVFEEGYSNHVEVQFVAVMQGSAANYTIPSSYGL